MSKPKPNDQTPEQPPRHEHSLEQIAEVARMLYAIEPFDVRNAAQFKVLVWKANIFLDNLHAACKAPWRPPPAIKMRLISDLVEVDKGVRRITNRPRTPEATHNFRTFVCYLATPQNAVTVPAQAKRFKEVFAERFKVKPEKMPEAMLAHWRNNGGIPWGDLVELRALYGNTWPRIRAEQNRRKAKKRGAKLNPKDKPVIREIVHEMSKTRRNV